MQLLIKYSELTEEIKKRTNHNVKLEYISSDTFKFSYPIKIPFFGTTPISLDIKVLGFDNLILKLKVTSDIISKILTLMPTLDISKYAIIEKDVIMVLLANIIPLRKVFMYIRPRLLRFDESNIIFEAVSL